MTRLLCRQHRRTDVAQPHWKPHHAVMHALGIAGFSLASLLLISAIRPAPTRQSPQDPVTEAQRHLLQLTIPEDMDTDVPAGVQHAISDLKQAIAVHIDSVMNRVPADASAASVKHRLSANMPPVTVGQVTDQTILGWSESHPKQPLAGLYGGELALSVSQPRPSLLLVQVSFHVACGNDNVLLVYGLVGGAWRRLLLWQAKPYDQISGAFGDVYETLLLKPELDRHPLLLVLHGTPWCTSTMSGFAMDVFALGESAAPNIPLWHAEHSYRRADLDPPLTLRATPDGFEVRTSVNGGGDVISRQGVMRYAVTASGIQRVEPLAINGRDSVVEWLALPRKEAENFADNAPGSLSWQMFQDFTYEGKARDATIPYPSFGPVRACSDRNTHFQAEVTSRIFYPAPKGESPGPAYFVQLWQVSNGYRIHAVTRRPDPSCAGPDLMAGH